MDAKLAQWLHAHQVRDFALNVVGILLYSAKLAAHSFQALLELTNLALQLSHVLGQGRLAGR